jgi:hypothetical protein
MGWSKGGGWLGDGGWYHPAVSADAAQTTAFLARTSGLSGTETAAYKALINGLVADGNFALLDALYIFATNTTATANLNLVSTSYGLTQNGTVAFSADHGYAGDGSTGYLDTGFVPSTAAGNYTQNSASHGTYILTPRITGATYAAMGTTAPSTSISSELVPWWTDNNTYSAVNGGGAAAAATTVKGMWAISRTGTNTAERYLNGSPNLADLNPSGALPNLSFLILVRRNAISGVASDFSTDQSSAVFMGGGLNATQAGQVSARINAYMTALGINVY